MTNNLLNLKKDLKSFAKRCKDFKYTDSALLAFLLSGMLISTEQVFAETVTNSQINNQVSQINTSINQMRTDFKRARTENNKLIKDTNLELTQLMEQGDHVTKSPWSSWQFGANGFYSDWHGTYKGKGNKISNIIYKRDQTLNKYIAKPVDEKTANNTTTLRFAYEPNAEIPISASITPKSISKVNPNIKKNVTITGLPSFEPRTVMPPVTPNIETPNPKVNVNLDINSESKGSGEERRAFATSGNAVFESVAVTSGKFVVTTSNGGYQSATSKYTASNVNVKQIYTANSNLTNALSGHGYGTNPNINTPTSSTLNNAFFQVNGSGSFGVTLNAADIDYTSENVKNNYMGELVHQDIHGGTTSSSAVDIALNTAGIIGLNTGIFLDIYKTIVFDTNTITKTDSYNVFANAGVINISGDKAVFTHSYKHEASNSTNGIIMNAGTVNLNKKTSGDETVHAVFLVSKDTYNNTNNQHFYNTGSVVTNTNDTAMFLFVPSEKRYISVANKGNLVLNGNNSVGIFANNGTKGVNLHLNFSDATSTGAQTQLGTTDTTDISDDIPESSNKNKYVNTLSNGIVNKATAQSNSKLMTINGLKSAGLYMPHINSFINGQFAVDIETAPEGSTLAQKRQNASAGIYSASNIDLQGHYIKIGDTSNPNIGNVAYNVGVYPVGGSTNTANIYLGKGSIELNRGHDNTGIVVKDNQGRVFSESEMVMNGGKNNTAIYSKGHLGNHADVVVKSIETGTNEQEDSIFLYADDNSKIKVGLTKTTGGTAATTGGLKIKGKISSGAPVYTASTKKLDKNVGGVYATSGSTVDVSQTGLNFGNTTANDYNISITGARAVDNAGNKTDVYAGFGLFADGSTIKANYNKIKAEDTGVAVASINSGSSVVLDNGEVNYKGSGYALYTDAGGTISLKDGKLVLDGNATGYIVDSSAVSNPITLTNTQIDVKSDNVILMDLRNPGILHTSGLATTLNGYLSGASFTPTSNNYKFKYAVVDGTTLNIDSNINKANATTTSDDYIFTRRLLLQNSILNVNNGNTLTAHLNSTELASINSNLNVPVGLAISASHKSVGNATTGVNVANGATITVDRTDSGNGGVGAYVNYGKVHNEGKIEVEKPTPNDHAVGIYATNGTEVNNDTTGTVDVGGKDSIGILGLSYRIDSTGNVVYEKFGTAGSSTLADGIGLVNVKNNGKITLDGDNSLGIYAKNNSLDATGTNAGYLRDSITHTNATNNGEITMTGKNAIGMIVEGGIATNDTKGKITISGQEGVAMYGTSVSGTGMTAVHNRKMHSELNNKGTIDLADTTTSTPIIGMFTNDADTDILTSGTINVGKKSYGIYGASNNVSMTGGAINVGDDGVGIFATGSSDSEAASVHSDVNLTGGTINVGNNQAVGVFIADDATNSLKTTVYNTGTNMTVGTNAFGYVVDSKTGTELDLGANGTGPISSPLTASIGTDSVYAYTNDKTGSVFSNTNITTTGGKSYGIYAAGEAVNYGTIDLTGGTGNVGIYSTGTSASGVGATNRGTINVGSTNVASKEYGIGMATGYYNETTGAISNEGLIENRGTINVLHENSIGMYAVGSGSKAINHGTIDISGKNATGMYIDHGAEGINYGTIKSTGSAKGIKGVATVNGGYIKNYGTISITSPDGIGIYQDAASALSQKNVPGNVSGTKANVYSATSTDQKYIVTPKGTLLIQNPPKTPRLTINGKEVALVGLDTNVASPTPSYVITAGATTLDLSLPQFADFKNSVSNAQATELGMYVDTSGVNYTHPIEGLSNLVGLDNINLIIGTEASKYTDAKAIEIGSNIIKPYNDAISSLTTTGTTLNINSAGLTWLAQPLQGTSTPIEKLYMIKIPYTFFTSEKDENSYNFLDGLEQRYGVEGLGTRERQIFDKLNGIGKGETESFTQAVDEMKGHQYSNTQQRINATGNTLDKEFKYLRDEWRNPSKQNNKIKAFGLRDEYNTDTAGVIDYTSNAYGVAYVHEDEKIRMGNSSGWYAGAVTNRFRFKDIGKSREQQTMLKLGVFKTMSPKGDHNGALQWTIGGDVFAGINNMKRKFWVVDDTFEAKSTYHTYGAALKNELGYDIRMSERTHLRPYGALKMEYGRFNDVKEDSGQMRLEVKGNDYFSVKPEAGLEFKYVQPLAVRTNLTVGLTAAYENELGKLQNGNQARVRYTTAGWYNLEKEKEDRRGNGKFDLNIGVDNTRFGVTVNAGYDTKGNNVRGGIGFRAIY